MGGVPIVLIGLVLGALVATWTSRRSPKGTALALAVLSALATLAILIAPSGRVAFEWVPQIGLEFAFWLDPLSRTMAALATGIGTLVFVYSAGYMEPDDSSGVYYPVLAAFQAAMVGLVLADNGILLFLSWELTGFTSYLLISHRSDSPTARQSARLALIVTGLGGLALLVPLCQFGPAPIHEGNQLAGSWIGYGCVLLAVFTKSAQFPFMGWLPGAMAAPTPVSAYLHSATMVQAGVYLTARFAGPLADFAPGVQAIAAATTLFALIRMVTAVDLKQILAYSTLGALGMLMAQAVLGPTEGLLMLLVAHGLYKAGLFFVAGAIDHGTGSRDVRKLSGLRSSMPLTAMTGYVLAASAIALPCTLAATAKARLAHSPMVELSLWLGAIGGVLAAVLVGVRPFVGSRSDGLAGHEAPVAMLAPAAILAGLGVLGGLAVDLSWSWGFLLPLCGGIGMLFLRSWLLSFRPARSGPNFLLSAVRQAVLVGRRVGHVAEWMFQGGHLSNYLRWILCGLGAGLFYASRLGDTPKASQPFGPVPLVDATVVILAIIAAVAAVMSPSRLGSVAALGIVGWAVAVVYSLYGAPDLAMTQLAVEVLTLILLVFTLGKLPKLPDRKNRATRSRDGVIAVGIGVGMAALCYFASHLVPSAKVASQLAARAYPEAHGRNVVNVILVDFRALDTLGEITVLCVAGMGVYTLLRKRQPLESGEGA